MNVLDFPFRYIFLQSMPLCLGYYVCPVSCFVYNRFPLCIFRHTIKPNFSIVFLGLPLSLFPSYLSVDMNIFVFPSHDMSKDCDLSSFDSGNQFSVNLCLSGHLYCAFYLFVVISTFFYKTTLTTNTHDVYRRPQCVVRAIVPSLICF